MIVVDCVLAIAMYDCFCWVSIQVTIAVDVVGLLDVVFGVGVFSLPKISPQKYACLSIGGSDFGTVVFGCAISLLLI